MKMTPDQKAASQALQKAVEDHIKAIDDEIGRPDNPMVVTDWITIVACEGYSDDGLMSSYYILMPNGEIAEHKALGLLKYGSRMLVDGGIVVRDDEEEDD